MARAVTLAIVLAAVGFAQRENEAVMISPSFAVEGQTIKGAPYSAQAVTSVKQTLATGSEISTQMTALVARDAEGRTRREQTLRAIGPWALGPLSEQGRRESPTVILIQDPVKQVNFTLDPRTHVARMSRQRSAAALEEERRRENARGEEASRREPRQERSESLGKQKIEGLLAEGRRTVTTFLAGSVGNSAAIEIVVDTWVSVDLHVVVMGKRNDPRVGDMTYRLVSIKRGDPPASLFEVPADYRVETDGERRVSEREGRKE
jgi:hypothetical protein